MKAGGGDDRGEARSPERPDDALPASAATEPRGENGGNSPNVAADVADDHVQVISLAASLYRDEMRRIVGWRDRLDRTSNWAVVLTATLLTWAFASEENPHYVMMIAIVAMLFFLGVEARRYRTYDIWRSRIRLLEKNLFANAFDPREAENQDWREVLARDLRKPAIRVPWIEAIQRRLRRFYYPIIVLLLAAWVLKIAVFVQPEATLVDAARVGTIPGSWVLGLIGLIFVVITVILVLPLKRQAAKEEHERSVEGEPWNE